ncbi:MAG: DUF3611 family protein [Cyanobacteria bacterium REEB459]|nr:DUF3611 family protein [Cyanobacteria bacterium REEB459]
MTPDLNYTLPPAVRRIANAFLLNGWISFWCQAVLAVIASLVLLFGLANLGTRSGAASNPGTAAGLSLTAIGLIVVYLTTYWAFGYTRLARRLRSRDGSRRPSPKDATTSLRLGIIISMAGTLVTLLGSNALVGSLLAVSLTPGVAFFVPGTMGQFVRPVDIFVMQGNTIVLLAHFIFLACTLWLLRTINRA